MRRLLQCHRWATLSVVVLLLFATSSMALSRMTCLMSGHSILALGMIDDCCPEPEPTEGATIAPVCCVFGQAALDVEPLLPSTSMELLPLIANDVYVSGTLVVAHKSLPAERLYGRAPPLEAVERLVLHSSFRI
ncbi:MAG: hypothetical protein WEC15_05810 [Flavobacteriales bacterium]